MASPHVIISARGEQRVRSGHPWIYRADVVDVRRRGRRHRAGGRAARTRRSASALFSDRSQIPIRMLTHGEATGRRGADRASGSSRRSHSATRCSSTPTPTGWCTARRICCRRSIVDRYGDYLVVQALSQGMDRLLPVVTQRCWSSCLRRRASWRATIRRCARSRGWSRRSRCCTATIPDSVVVREGPCEYDVDLRKGQKTGLFLDQRENREAAARYARGRLLDCFSYNGGFALRLARQCPTAEALDISADAVARIRAQRRPQRRAATSQAREANVFDELRRLERAGDRYDTIVLDPPAFAKNKASVPNALAGYKEINLRAMRLLVAGRLPGDLQLLVQRQRRDVRRRAARGVGRQPHAGGAGREADAGPRPSGAGRRARDVLPEVLHPATGRVMASRCPRARSADRAGHRRLLGHRCGVCRGVRRAWLSTWCSPPAVRIG